ncbi:MAG: NAD(P)H-dependent oxidoreductase subunit E [Rhodobacteraceae bacterium]|nr:NAD(P)H-dependent oxidoreductase subunit E [Paracoccaceae bacterium]
MTTPSSPDKADSGIAAICAGFGNDRHRLLDILLAIQQDRRWISPAAMEAVAAALGMTRIAVEGVASFYSFLSLVPKGRVTIRLCDDIVDRFAGLEKVAAAFAGTLGVAVGQTSADGAFSLDFTPCIGLCDQAPAAMINDVVATRLTPARATAIAQALLRGVPPGEAVVPGFDGLAPADRVRRQADSNIRVAGDILLGPVPRDAGLRAALALAPAAIIDVIEASGLRGCGGAGFATGRKWRIAAGTPAERRFVICNADEGEPGTFKDRVLLTERPDLVVEGMTIAARAIGAREGILYLRGEYAFLREHLEAVLAGRRAAGTLGGDFDIRIQMGAGAYVCGEEGALISSCEGLPGEPRTRPPFPVTRGYLGQPTVVNNVETFAHAARILDIGADRFRAAGTGGSPGTKLYSVSGDCDLPGVYELPAGLPLADLLERAGAAGAAAVQVGGPSGTLVGREDFGRRLAFDDLSTGGAVIAFGARRNILEIVEYYLSFFVHESCGYCTPCRVGNVFLRKAIAKFRAGLADEGDIAYLRDLSATIAETSRCGLGMTSPNPVLSSLQHFPLVYSALARPRRDGLKATFSIQAAIEGARRIAGRRSYIFDRDFSE